MKTIVWVIFVFIMLGAAGSWLVAVLLGNTVMHQILGAVNLLVMLVAMIGIRYLRNEK